MNLRVPAGRDGAALSVNGHVLLDAGTGTYAPITADWNPGDVVDLDLPMPPACSTATTRVLLRQSGRASLFCAARWSTASSRNDNAA